MQYLISNEYSFASSYGKKHDPADIARILNRKAQKLRKPKII